MVFKRRNKRPLGRAILESLWPKGGWGRAFSYVRHRLHRLNDNPHRIARGIWAGVFTTFTPFYGLHFLTAAAISLVFRGNILAALLATFFGNPLTYVPIGVVSLKTGHFLLGTEFAHEGTSLAHKFAAAGWDLWHNLMTWITGDPVDWSGLHLFADEVFFPYLIGGIIPGIIAGGICYWLSLPVIKAYQKRRKGAIKAKLAAIKAKAQRH